MVAFNGSGTYNLPAGNPVTTGTTISSSWANTTLSDIATALTNCITRDGQSPPTANIPHGGYKLTGLGQASATGDALGWGQNASIVNLTVTGTATLSADPTLALQATTKQYVDGVAGGFPSGTAMLFAQTSAPTGWTKSTTHNDKALRVVSGTASSGGTYTFSSTFANGNTGATTLSLSQSPGHYHGLASTNYGLGSINTWNGIGSSAGNSVIAMGSIGNTPNGYFSALGSTGYQSMDTQGGGGSHTHPLSLAVQYVDVIIATKN